ncbi:MAG: hypothetical protein ACRED4_01900, partial [Brevundimonas sp.]
MALLLWGIFLALHEDSRLAWVFGGVLAALSSGWRYEFAVVAVLAAVPLVIRHRRAPFLIAGGLVGALPTSWHVAHNFDAVYANVVTGRVNGNFQASPELVGTVAPLLTWLCALTACGLLILGIVQRDRALASLAVAGVAMLPQAFQRIDSYHAAFVGCLVLPLAAAVIIGRRGDALVARSTLGRRVGIGLLALLPVLSAFISVAIIAQAHDPITLAGRSLPTTDKARAAMLGLYGDLKREVPAESVVFMGTEELSRPASPYFPLYFLLWEEYEFPQYYLDHAIGVAENDPEQVIADIAESDALILLDVDPEETRLTFPNVPHGSTEPDAFLRREFCAVAEHDPLT